MGNAVGTFVTSPGLGGVAAVLAALIAAASIRKHAAADRKEQRQSEARDRRWQLAVWVDQQIDDEKADPDDLIALLIEMEASASTKEQRMMVGALLGKITKKDR